MQYNFGLLSFIFVSTVSSISNPTEESCYILRVSQNTDKLTSRKIRGLMRRHNISLKRVYPDYQKGFFICTANDTSLRFLKSQRSFIYIEKDQTIRLLQVQNDAPWGLSRLCTTNLPISGSYNFSKTGKGVNVYILDSGVITNHPGTDHFFI